MTNPFISKISYSEKPELKLALFSDLHIGAEDTDMKSMRRDFKTSADEGRKILINGDIAELILPNDRKRYTPSKALSDRNDVINETMEICLKELKPYADFIDFIGTGNHEESTLKFNNFDLVGALVVLLNRERSSTLPPIHRAGYQGYIQYKLVPTGKRNACSPFTIYHHHGSGGSAPVSKGMIDFNRIDTSHNALLYWLGHKHVAITDNGRMKDGLTSFGNYEQWVEKAMITPGYKTHELTKEYKMSYSDRFYNMQAKGYGIVDVFIDRSQGKIDHFDIALRT